MSNRKGLLLAIAIIIMGMFITAGSYAFWSWVSGTNKNVTYKQEISKKVYFSGRISPILILFVLDSSR